MSELKPVVPVMGYASAVEEIRLRWLLAVAKVLGAVPLVVGFGCLMGYVVSRDLMFAFGGLYTIALGIILLCIGLICVTIFRLTNRLKHRVLRLRAKRAANKATLLLLANIPAAIFCVIVGIALLDRHGKI